MRTILEDVEHWQTEGKKVALATVIKVYGSAPRPLGSKMAISSGGDMVGSVSGPAEAPGIWDHRRISRPERWPGLRR
jgi:xanthine/CO dehydrogenase XdhC/CoxF family maturation factor